MAETCKTCRFFIVHASGHNFGDCHRMPPAMEFSANFREEGVWSERPKYKAEITHFRNGVWPNVSQDEWCGEHAYGPAKSKA